MNPAQKGDTVTVPFGRVLRLGSTGTQPVGVKRALWRAGYRAGWGKLDGPAVSAKVLGAFAVKRLKAFQRASKLTADGVYGPATHAKLTKHFDDYARLLYTGVPPASSAYLTLPATFTPTHPTAGLAGYPAIDVFAKPGTVVLSPADGNVRRCSGKNPNLGGVPGGAYGWNIYLAAAHGEYFLAHFGTRFVTEGVQVKRGDRLGTVCDAKVAGMNSDLSHIHEGLRAL